MENVTISMRLDKKMHEKMKQHNEINWSAILRKALAKELEKMRKYRFDIEKARNALKDMEKIRNSGIFDRGKSSVEIIREWRNKRKF